MLGKITFYGSLCPSPQTGCVQCYMVADADFYFCPMDRLLMATVWNRAGNYIFAL